VTKIDGELSGTFHDVEKQKDRKTEGRKNGTMRNPSVIEHEKRSGRRLRKLEHWSKLGDISVRI